ncbi:hypothetical protein D3C85_1551560 [compost metagenome]
MLEKQLIAPRVYLGIGRGNLRLNRGSVRRDDRLDFLFIPGRIERENQLADFGLLGLGVAIDREPRGQCACLDFQHFHTLSGNLALLIPLRILAGFPSAQPISHGTNNRQGGGGAQ